MLNYAERKIALKERVVFQTKHWGRVVSFWATRPFETLLLPLADISHASDLNEIQPA